LSLAVGSGSAWFVTIFNINFGSQSGLGRCCADVNPYYLSGQVQGRAVELTVCELCQSYIQGQMERSSNSVQIEYCSLG